VITSNPRLRIGIDIGGTFTDFVILNEVTGDVRLEKIPTTPGDLSRGIGHGLDLAGIDQARVTMVVHGTTVGLNCFLEKKGARTGLITTAGFRDVYEIGRVNREDMYDLFYQKPAPLVPREHRWEVRERLDASGNVLMPVHEDDVWRAANAMRLEGIDSIAVCLLHAYANPAHEIRVGELVKAAHPQALVTLSHELVREWREYERTSTTSINAYIARVVEGYLERIEAELAGRGYRGQFFVNQSSGGVMSVAAAKGKPVRTIMSGPAGGAVSAAFVGRHAGFPNIISFDMGGTSTDVAVTWQGNIRVTAEARIERHPIMVPMVDVRSIGAGGGSIAAVSGGVLDVGPRSAGAEPGPAGYGRGGTEPTVTDANLVLGRLGSSLLGGRMELDATAAETAIASRVAQELRLSPQEAATGILRIVNSKMAYAIRAMTVQRGLDPGDFALMAFGGAGPMHACAIAEELGVPTVVVPVAPGAFSALGMLVSDIRHDFVRTRLQKSDEVDLMLLAELFEEMEEEATAAIAAEAPPQTPVVLERFLDLRYVGQEYTVKVPVTSPRLTPEELSTLRTEFDRLHEQTYGHASTTEPTEIINARLTAYGTLRYPELPRISAGPPEVSIDAHLGEAEAWFEGSGSLRCPIYDRGQLLAGNHIDGPALILESGATTVIYPRFMGTVDAFGNLVLHPTERA